MTVDERRRNQLVTRLVDVLGDEAAITMSEMLPPAGSTVATTSHLDALGATLDQRFALQDARFDARFEAIDARFEAIDARFEAIDARFEAVDARFDGMDQRFDRVESGLEDVRRELFAVRGEIVTAVSGQTRAMLIGMFTAIASIAGLSWTFSALV